MNLFDEIRQYHRADLALAERYARLYSLLERVCKELTADYGTDFSNLFSRLYALCRQTGLGRTPIERFRMNARRVMRGEVVPTADDYLYDLKALCEAISHFCHLPIPPDMAAVLPAQWRAQADVPHRTTVAKRIRLVVDHWDERFVYGYSDEWQPDTLLRADFTVSDAFHDLPQLLHQGAQLNLLTVATDGEGTLLPELFVLQPDYLIDISALAECVQSYGSHPLNYLVSKFRPRETTHHILLGNAANQFLDDCVNATPDRPATYGQSIRKVFRDAPLAYTACEGIDRDYFQRAEAQFRAIRETVQAVFNSPTCQIDKDGALLEPSFLCECLGLQGRMDFLQGDFRNLIELKSGKAEGMGAALRPRESHALQMALYKEVLFYSLDIPREAVSSYLFYSQYPKLFAERSAKAQIQRAMALRNHIVAGEWQLMADGGRSQLPAITPDMLNTRQAKGRLWTHFQRPQLEAFLAPLHTADELTMDYFHTFAAFLAREQFMAKMGDARPDGNNGFAATWNTDASTKLAAGEMMTGLRIRHFVEGEGIEKVVLDMPPGDEATLPNFRTGDIVMLYQRESLEANATNRQVLRGTIERLTSTSLVVALKNRQRNAQVFHPESPYAIEHDFMDASYGPLYRGLYALLTTPAHRRDLLLGRRRPEADATLALTGTYLTPQIDDIVLRAKQARDYFLLVGPPGTGKTSVALRSMVEELHSRPDSQLLLLSYTNRAVDEMCDMLESIAPTPPPYLRIGGELSCDERFRPHLLREMAATCDTRHEVTALLARVRIVVGTVSSISGHPELFRLKRFDVAIIDEASQILEPHLLPILCAHQGAECAIGKFILIGDHKQLPAVVLQRPQESAVHSPALQAIGLTDCRHSLFERLHRLQADDPATTAMLHRQGRMHPAISHFANLHFYGGRLDVVPVAHQTAPLEWTRHDATDPMQRLVATRRTGFIHSPYPPAEDSPKVNRHEARTAARLVEAIHALCQRNGLPFDPARRVGIIVPFRGQIATIAHELSTLGIAGTEAITIDTVERYQGSQRDIIIFSTTVSQPYQLGILSVTAQCDGQLVDRKLNVALTRARKQLFILGNTHLLSQSDIYRRLIEAMEGGIVNL